VCCEYHLDPANHFSIRTRLPEHNYDCCGPRVIDIESEDCTGEGLPGMETSDGAASTCGPLRTVYNPLTQICCRGTTGATYFRRYDLYKVEICTVVTTVRAARNLTIQFARVSVIAFRRLVVERMRIKILKT
jgi:hypothetical protein